MLAYNIQEQNKIEEKLFFDDSYIDEEVQAGKYDCECDCDCDCNTDCNDCGQCAGD